MNTMGFYHDFYFKKDVLFLADVFEKFISTCLDYYRLYPCHYFRNAGISWDAMLKMAGIELDLISDVGMHLFIEKGMRGGISYTAKRHSKANNKYMKCYHEYKESKFITYLDANNLYGWAMSRYLPYCELKWLNEKEIDKFCLNSIEENSPVGYILEADLKYPNELHELHNDYSLSPEKLEISHIILSTYCSSCNDYGIKIGGVNKLVPNLRNKSKYALHYRNLQLYLSLGIKLTKVHKNLKFKQSDWLKKYIDFNTDKRKNAAYIFEKDLFNLMNNNVFGKAMENLRKRINVRLANKAKDYVRYINKLSFISQKIFNKKIFNKNS